MTVGLRAFTDIGHDGVNLHADILDVAGVSASSFYYQFTDKTDLLLTILREAVQQRRDAIMGPPPDVPLTPEETIHGIFERLFRSVDTEAHGWQAQLHIQWVVEPRIRAFVIEAHGAWFARLTQFFQDLTGTDRARAERMARAFFSTAYGFATSYLDLSVSERERWRGIMAEDAATFAVAGLTAMLPDTPRPTNPQFVDSSVHKG